MNNYRQEDGGDNIHSVARLQKGECIDDPRGQDCRGRVEERPHLSASGKSFPRCQKHWELRLREQQIGEGLGEASYDFYGARLGKFWDEEY